MTIDEAKKLLPAELKYPLPDETIDKLMEVKKITIALSESRCIGKHYEMMAAVID